MVLEHSEDQRVPVDIKECMDTASARGRSSKLKQIIHNFNNDNLLKTGNKHAVLFIIIIIMSEKHSQHLFLPGVHSVSSFL